MSQSTPRTGMYWLLAVGLGLTSAAQAVAAGKAYYVRFRLSDDATTYVQIQDKSMRMATSVEGIAAAKPMASVRADKRSVQFRSVPLPVDAAKMPAGLDKVSTQLSLYNWYGGRRLLTGSVTIAMRDEQKTLWTYVGRVQMQPGNNAGSAPLVDLAGLKTLSITFGTKKQRSRQMGVGLYFKAGKLNIQDVRQNGRPALVSVKVTDEAGNVVATKKGRLSDFGFG